MPPESLIKQATRRMDELVRRAIGLAEQKTKTASSVPWKTDQPWKQLWYPYSSSKGQWEAQPPTPQQQPNPIKRLELFSWNIDFMLPFPDSRMRAAIRHLESLVQRSEDTASVIFLQECVASDLTLIAADPWIQQTFAITDTSTENWQSGHYGTTTLIDRKLAVKDVFRVHYEQTRMQRDGLFVDIALRSSTSNQELTFRFCNTHLESLALEPPLRPVQIALCAEYMHADGIAFGAAAGDFNAIQDFDKTLHTDNDLQDAYLERGGSEDNAEAGHTWGQQAATTQRERFGTSRMDKVFFCGHAMKCVEFEKIGAGIEVEAEEERKVLVELGFDRPWITDHLGVKAVFEVA